MVRRRLRDMGVSTGWMPVGSYNAITDVPGVLVGHSTIIADTDRIARTGVTVIVPREGEIWTDLAFAGSYAFNGCGEMTGLSWLEECGWLSSAIGITNTFAVGAVHEGLIAYASERDYREGYLPVVAETDDGWLNDMAAFHVTRAHVNEALASARSGPVAEGNVGGGTGMICHDFKGGIGTSSRIVETRSGTYTLGALVQANHGERSLLRVDGVPIGREIGEDHTPSAYRDPAASSSIIVIIATDAPLLPLQCKRLARRATVGLARAGGTGHNGSGDIFLAFATGNHVPAYPGSAFQITMFPQQHMDPLFEAVAEAVEEAILNALTAAETMVGINGHTAYALPLDDLERLMKKYRH